MCIIIILVEVSTVGVVLWDLCGLARVPDCQYNYSSCLPHGVPILIHYPYYHCGLVAFAEFHASTTVLRWFPCLSRQQPGTNTFMIWATYTSCLLCCGQSSQVNAGLLVLTCVSLCLPDFTHVYQCCYPLYTCFYLCILVSICVYLYLLVYLNVILFLPIPYFCILDYILFTSVQPMLTFLLHRRYACEHQIDA